MLRSVLVSSLAAVLAACAGDVRSAPTRDGTSVEYADDWVAEAQARCPSDDAFEACGFIAFARDDELPARGAGAENFRVRYHASEDIDGVGWQITRSFAAAIGCDVPTTAPTEDGELDCPTS